MTTEYNQNPNKYKLSFIGADLALSESIKIAELYLQLKNWDAVKEKVKTDNVLQARTQSTIQRVYQELSPRLAQLTDDQLELLVEGTIPEQKHLLWYAICNRYKLIQEFAIEVIHEKYMVMDFELTELNYDAFFNRKVDWHEELDEITSSTKQKLKTVIFRMLREAEIITTDNLIVLTILSERLIEVLAPAAPLSYQIFPLQLSDIEG